MADQFLSQGFSGALRIIMSSEDFYLLDDSQKGLYINQAIEGYMEKYNLSSEEDKNILFETAEKEFSKYKAENNISKYVPSQADQIILYEPLVLSPSESATKRIIAIETWRDASYKKARSLRPADAPDIRLHLNQIFLEKIRTVSGENTSWLQDKGWRFLEGFFSPPSRLTGVTFQKRLLAEYFPESPRYDNDAASEAATVAGIAFFYVTIIALLIFLKRIWTKRKSARTAH